MKELSEITNVPITEVEEYLKCENDKILISCHLNQDGKAFVLVKTENERLVEKIKTVLNF